MSDHPATALTMAHDSINLGPGIVSVLLIAVAGAFLVFFLAALVGILGANLGCGAKILWFLVILSLPFLGSLLWFVVGRKTAEPRP